MRLKNFTAPDMPTALAQVREVLGADAVIVSQEKNAAGQIELTAAVEDADEISFNRDERVEVKPARWKYDDGRLRESPACWILLRNGFWPAAVRCLSKQIFGMIKSF